MRPGDRPILLRGVELFETARERFVETELRILRFWRENGVFQKTLEQGRARPEFVFYEGPPTANGTPHPGHVLTRVIKDVFPRYKTMTGFHVPRKAGWDTHGLPVEIEVEKELDLADKEAVERYGVEPFVRKCMESVWKYKKAWEDLTDRIGFWIDLGQAYVTYTTDYIESVWWALSEIHKKGLLYRGHKIVPWCPRCGTVLSSHELGWGYRSVQDPSLTVRFRLKADPKTSFLAWTTTPWTLLSNAALSVHPGFDYAFAEKGGETFILAKDLVEQVLGQGARVKKVVKGRDLENEEYEPLFPFVRTKKAYLVVLGDFVTLEQGTGVVHTAPAFGADDHEVGKAYGLDVICLVDARGNFTEEAGRWKGRFVKEADESIVEDLDERGLLFSRGTMTHDYPHCWRCSSPLLYYPRSAWFIRTTTFVERMLEKNARINWCPAHIRDGRFGNFLRDNVDWALSRERYWGTPLNIWTCAECGKERAPASKAEIVSINPRAFDAFEERRARDPSLNEHFAVHKPFIDEVTFPCECGGEMKRAPEVIDCWFDSGAMPFAQFGWPHAGKEEFKRAFPADFISEAIDQTRGWFYSLVAIGAVLFNREPFKNCIVLGLVCDERGEKMSKSKGNYLDPSVVLDSQGADALRWYFCSANQPWTFVRFSEKAVALAQKDFLVKLRNIYSFFSIYANIDGFEPGEEVNSVEEASPDELSGASTRRAVDERGTLDRWILSELSAATARVKESLDSYDIHSAAQALFGFADDLSNWYVRRSRDRFWKSVKDADKFDAYWTLYECMVAVSKLIAPFTPFYAEDLYGKLVRSQWKDARESVHMCGYPKADDFPVEEKLSRLMRQAREVASLGREARAKRTIRVRQPRLEAQVISTAMSTQELVVKVGELVADELNVKKLEFREDAGGLVSFEIKPNYRALGPKFGSRMPEITEALASLDANEVRAKVARGESVRISAAGEDIDLSPDELDIRVEPREGYTASASARTVVVLDTRITEELRLEGFARELVSKIQGMRRELDLPYEARIVTHLSGDEYVDEVLRSQGEYIRRETLTKRFVAETPAGALVKEVRIEGRTAGLAIARACPPSRG